MSRHSVLTHTRLHPRLVQLQTHLRKAGRQAGPLILCLHAWRLPAPPRAFACLLEAVVEQWQYRTVGNAVLWLSVCWQASCCDRLPAATGQNEVVPVTVEPAQQRAALPHSVQSWLASRQPEHSSLLASKRSARIQQQSPAEEPYPSNPSSHQVDGDIHIATSKHLSMWPHAPHNTKPPLHPRTLLTATEPPG